jgi:hypothetical protein
MTLLRFVAEFEGDEGRSIPNTNLCSNSGFSHPASERFWPGHRFDGNTDLVVDSSDANDSRMARSFL